jgi:hypothetical protein
MGTPNNPQGEDFASDFENNYKAMRNPYIPRWVFDILYAALYAFLLVKYSVTSRVLGLNSTSFLEVLLWVILMFIIIEFVWGSFLHIIVGPSLFYKYTGMVYQESYFEYGRAGGYDIRYLSVLLTHVGVLGIYWWTSTISPDPIAAFRDIGWCIGATILVSLILHVVLSRLAFKLYAQSPK